MNNIANRLTIIDLHRKMNEKNEKKSLCYERVLEICNRRVLSSADRHKTSCFFEFPEYVIGYPLFDLNACMEYCKKQLVANGFLVNYYFPNKFYISWDYEEIKQHKVEQRKQTPLIAALPTHPLLLPVSSQVQSQTHVHTHVHTQAHTQVQPHVQPQVPSQVQPQVSPQVPSQVSPQVQPQVQRASLLENMPDEYAAKITKPLPESPPKYDPFDIYSAESNKKTKTVSPPKPSAIQNTFFANSFKDMLTSSIGSNQKTTFDYKPSGKYTLNL
jgi:hypothetical protein